MSADILADAIEGALDHCEVAQHTEAVTAMVTQRLADNGYRIATPEVVAAIRRVVEREREDRKHIGPFLSDADLAALDGLIGDGR